MPPWAAFEWDRTGWTLDRIPTAAPASAAARAARWPARPAPITSTSWSGMRRRRFYSEFGCRRTAACRPVCTGRRRRPNSDHMSHVPHVAGHEVVAVVAGGAPERLRRRLAVAHEGGDPAGSNGGGGRLERAPHPVQRHHAAGLAPVVPRHDRP